VAIVLLTACSQDPNAITTPLTSSATPGANDCALPAWSDVPEATIAIELQSGRHDDMSLLEIDGATGAYLARLTGDDKLLGAFTGNDLAVTRLGADPIAYGGGCSARIEADFAGQVMDNTMLSGTLTYTPYLPTSMECTCSSTVMFGP
jgi:hypothetical protein